MKITNKLLKKYADLIAVKGVNVQKGQPVRIKAPIEEYKFVEILVSSLYKHGAADVVINWSSDKITRANYRYKSIKTLKTIPQPTIESEKYYLEHQFARISLSSNDPDLLKGLNQKKIQAASIASSKALSKYSDPYMASQLQWCVAAVPNVAWAKKVFPNLSKRAAKQALWEEILKCVRIDENNDCIEAWNVHDKRLHDKCEILNALKIVSLHYRSLNGTDFVIKLPKGHIWAGGAEYRENTDILFNPNMPTEEVFTMPERNSINGKVVSTKPLSYEGKLIENFSFIFKDGKVVSCDAEKNIDVLKSLINTDEGSSRLGEVALVPCDSPIYQSGVLFYNTLFDENASCHLALGQCYSMNLEGGTSMSKEELLAHGGNDSLVHVDFMIGTGDLEIIATTEDHREVTIFKNGTWAI